MKGHGWFLEGANVCNSMGQHALGGEQPKKTPTHRMYCFRFILQNIMKPLTHFFFICVGQGAVLFFLGFTGPLPAQPFLVFLPGTGRVEARRVGVHV